MNKGIAKIIKILFTLFDFLFQHIPNFRRQSPDKIESSGFESIAAKRLENVSIAFDDVAKRPSAFSSPPHLHETSVEVCIGYLLFLNKTEHQLKVGRDGIVCIKGSILFEALATGIESRVSWMPTL